jgi:FtsP/CotA-like multicopper oxidase with cupredoxin domain
MQGTPFMDGASTVTQCPVGPMQTQVYEFVAMDVGTHYWHGHLSMDRTDGFQGPIIIEDPNDEAELSLMEQYESEETVFLQDWYHMTGGERRTGLDSEPFIWIGNGQTYIVNGKGRFPPCFNQDDGTPTGADNCDPDCSQENYIAPLLPAMVPGMTYRLRLINAGELVGINFAIAGHKLTVVEVEGTLVEPFEVSDLSIMPAQRYSVLVTADQEPGPFWATTTVMYRNVGEGNLVGYSYVNYEGTSLEGPPIEGVGSPTHPVWDDPDSGPGLDAKLFSADVSKHGEDAGILSKEADRELIIVGTQARHPDTNQLRWATNNVTQTFSATPVILSAYRAVREDGAAAWPDTDIPGTIVVPDKPPSTWNYTEPIQQFVGDKLSESGPIVIKLSKGNVVDLVLQNALALNGVAEMHSWHLHGHKFYVIGEGYGTFDPETDPDNFNLVNPVFRDTVALWPKRWVAIRFLANNPGVWAFHCTMNSHSVMGMGFNFVISPDLLEKPPQGIGSCLSTSLIETDEDSASLIETDDDPDDTTADDDHDDTTSGGRAPRFMFADSGFVVATWVITMLLLAGGI